ncbi:MAG TPA: hypothetical protein VNS55_04535 [Nocardioides sp.]|nr:hypothetical protein [Nocardioides sp.]
MAVEFLEVRLYEALWTLPDLRPVERDVLVDLCAGLVEDCLELAIEHRGRAVRCAVQLMVSEMNPALDPAVRDDLARMCEVAVVART